MHTLIINRDDVERLLPMPKCIELMREALIAASLGDAQFPLRTVLPVAGRNGYMALMPGQHRGIGAMGAKIISIFPENHQAGLESHQGVVLLFDTNAGYPLAIIDAAAITAIRTAAASGAATEALARSDAETLCILGSGVQAKSHLQAMLAVRKIKCVKIWSRRSQNARQFLDTYNLSPRIKSEIVSSVQEAVEDADIICSTTAAAEPIVKASWLKPGAHINAVGACTPTTREFDSETIRQASVFVDCYESAFREAGEIMIPLSEKRIGKGHIKAELGEVFAGRKNGRKKGAEITFFKSLGIAAEDLVAAHFIWQQATEMTIGAKFSFEGSHS